MRNDQELFTVAESKERSQVDKVRVHVAYGNYTPVVGEGPIDVSEHLSLPFVLHFPQS